MHIASAAALFGVMEDDVVLRFARPNVDVAVEQVLTALTTGACVVIPAKPLLAPAELLGLLEAEGVTVADLSAGYFQEVVTAPREHGTVPRTLRLMISGGDPLYPTPSPPGASSPASRCSTPTAPPRR